MELTYVTKSDIPFREAFYMPDRFIILNMWKQGVWFVDQQHPDWEQIKQTALDIAKTFGDSEQIKKLTK